MKSDFVEISLISDESSVFSTHYVIFVSVNQLIVIDKYSKEKMMSKSETISEMSREWIKEKNDLSVN